MQIRTDDDVYRVDAVWLGPPRATFPWRARYSSYGVGLIVMIVVMFVQRRLGIPIGFFSIAWALLITVVVVRFVSKRINEDRPLLEWLTLFWHEVRGPRRRTRGAGSTVGTGHVAIEPARPRAALPPGRHDPHAEMAVREDGPRTSAPGRERPRRRPKRSWTTRAGGTGARRGVPTGATRGTAPDTDPDGVLRVRARRADRPSRGTAASSGAARRYGPGATGGSVRNEEGDGVAPGRS
ncbi:hypothetical protein [Actinomycetospora termitidis]|uniref:Uncharacterized protein n=1 Tax=Actinomycetospora termitidis TaxID=3053470 RepID=A0ABT7M2Z8_9PSEU|nr:hypothetical protein [Actinomycetospora sp. Odt1-22]MDL5155043.1 hypothetical protein [Actinomycetospora sp. Odt1-22]